MEIQGKSTITINRSQEGVPHVKVTNEEDLYYGLGYCHAMDRGIQMMLMRILGTGTASEHLSNTDEMLEIDKFFRQMDWSNHLDTEIEKFTPEELAKLNAYCDGVNYRFSQKQPWELKRLLGYKNFSWTVADILMMSRMAGFLTLAQSQGEIERLFIQMVQKGVSKKLLNELFPDVLGDYDEDLIKQIQLKEKIVPDAVKWNTVLNPMMASNNWVVSGKKTSSKSPILANDPHLEINRLPPVWYEIKIDFGELSVFSATMPGISSILISRNKHLAWGATYTFMDAIDSWIEKCKDGKYFKDDVWHEFKVRTEVIKRKKKDPVTVTFYENEHGVLEGDPNQEGYYLSTLWSGKYGGAKSIKSGLKLIHAQDVTTGMKCLGDLEMSFNWVMADSKGNIGYQMSGSLPIRKNGNSGFAPLIGWNSTNDWQGFYSPEELPRSYNPECGYIVTANENLSEFGKVNPHTIAMGSYRSDRIKSLLKDKNDFSTKDMQEMHYDVYSSQAELFMPYILPLLPDTESGKILKEWDYQYDTSSKGAYLFEQIYKALYQEVFGEVFGNEVHAFLQKETGVFTDFYDNFDRILLADHSGFFEKSSKEELYKNAIAKGLKRPIVTWGSQNKFDLTHIVLGGQLPKFLGFDKGPYPMPGGRATIHQGQIYEANGRKTSFAPSFRMVTDLSEDCVYTNLPGGASDRRFSKYYVNDFKNWQERSFKKIKI